MKCSPEKCGALLVAERQSIVLAESMPPERGNPIIKHCEQNIEAVQKCREANGCGVLAI
jgi:hypothetical protein